MNKFKGIVPAILLAVSGLTYATTTTAPASTPMAEKVGVVDVQQLMQQSPEVAAINKKLRAEFNPQQQKIMAKQKELQAEVAELNKNGPTLNNDQRLKMRDKIIADRASLQAMGQTLQQSSALAQNQAMHTLFTQLQNAVDTVAKKDGYTLIIQRAAVLYSLPNTDVTKQVLDNMPKA